MGIILVFLLARLLRNALFEASIRAVGLASCRCRCWPLEHSRYSAKNINIGVARSQFEVSVAVLITLTCFFSFSIFFFLERPHVRPLRNPTRLAGVVKRWQLGPKLPKQKKRSPKRKSEKSTKSQTTSQPSAFGPGLQLH